MNKNILRNIDLLTIPVLVFALAQGYLGLSPRLNHKANAVPNSTKFPTAEQTGTPTPVQTNEVKPVDPSFSFNDIAKLDIDKGIGRIYNYSFESDVPYEVEGYHWSYVTKRIYIPETTAEGWVPKNIDGELKFVWETYTMPAKYYEVKEPRYYRNDDIISKILETLFK